MLCSPNLAYFVLTGFVILAVCAAGFSACSQPPSSAGQPAERPAPTQPETTQPETTQPSPSPGAEGSLFDHPLLELIEEVSESSMLGVAKQDKEEADDLLGGGAAFRMVEDNALDLNDVEGKIRTSSDREKEVWSFLREFKTVMHGPKTEDKLMPLFHPDFASPGGGRAETVSATAEAGKVPFQLILTDSTLTLTDQEAVVDPVYVFTPAGLSTMRIVLTRGENGQWSIIRGTPQGESVTRGEERPHVMFSEIYDPRGAYVPVFTPQY